MLTDNYTFDPNKVEFVAGVARLILPATFATIRLNEVFNTDAFTSLTETVNKAGSDNVTYQMIVDGTPKYFSGTWVTSDESLAQSSSAASVTANASSLMTSTSPHTLQVQVCLSGSGSTTPEISELVIKYDHVPFYSSAENKCTVYCYLRDILGQDLTVLTNAPRLIAVNDTAFFNDGHLVPRFYQEVDFASDGTGLVASLELEQTEDVDQGIRFLVTYQPSAVSSRTETVFLKPAVVPNQNQIDLMDLTSVDTSQLL